MLKKLLVLALLAGTAHANHDAGSKFSIGLEGYRNKTELMGDSERGRDGGINAAFTHNFANHYFMGLDGRVLGGKIKEVKTLQGNLNFVVGYHFNLNACTTLSPFIGLGLHQKRFKVEDADLVDGFDLDDDFDFDADDGVTVKLKARRFTLPIGATLQFPLASDWDMKLGAQVDFMLKGKTKFDLGIASQTFTQNKGTGVKLNADFIKKLGNGSSISFGPSLEHFKTKRSKSVYVEALDETVSLPEAKETLLGVNVRFKF